MPIRKINIRQDDLQEQCLLLLDTLTREETDVTEEDIRGWSEEDCEEWLDAWDDDVEW